MTPEETFNALVSAEIGTLALLVVLGVIIIVWRSRIETRPDVTPDLIRLVQQKETSLHDLTARAREDAKNAAAAAAAEHKAYLDALAKLSENIGEQSQHLTAMRHDIRASFEAQSLVANDRHAEVLGALSNILEAISDKKPRKRAPSLWRIQSDVQFIRKVLDNAKAIPPHLARAAHERYGADSSSARNPAAALGGFVASNDPRGGAGSPASNGGTSGNDDLRTNHQRSRAGHRRAGRERRAGGRGSDTRQHNYRSPYSRFRSSVGEIDPNEIRR
jgi:hypothetical protein